MRVCLVGAVDAGNPLAYAVVEKHAAVGGEFVGKGLMVEAGLRFSVVAVDQHDADVVE